MLLLGGTIVACIMMAPAIGKQLEKVMVTCVTITCITVITIMTVETTVVSAVAKAHDRKCNVITLAFCILNT